jgi:hypothetical protein
MGGHAVPAVRTDKKRKFPSWPAANGKSYFNITARKFSWFIEIKKLKWSGIILNLRGHIAESVMAREMTASERQGVRAKDPRIHIMQPSRNPNQARACESEGTPCNDSRFVHQSLMRAGLQ